MVDQIWASWLEAQYLEATELAARSDVLRIAPVAGVPPHKLIIEFRCNGLARDARGVSIRDRHVVGIAFPEDYLRRSPNPGQVLTWLEPHNEFHPNISAPFICVGHIPPGMSLVSLLHQLWQMVTWARFTPREDDALNREACVWARHNLARLPVDSRRSMLAPASHPVSVEAPHGLD